MVAADGQRARGANRLRDPHQAAQDKAGNRAGGRVQRARIGGVHVQGRGLQGQRALVNCSVPVPMRTVPPNVLPEFVRVSVPVARLDEQSGPPERPVELRGGAVGNSRVSVPG